MKKVSIIILIIVCSLITYNVKAANVGCTYVIEKDSCDGDYEIQGETFTAVINIDKDPNLKTLIIDNSTVTYYNNTEATDFVSLKDDKTSVSAVDYYAKYRCPPYFAIEDVGEAFQYDGYFMDGENSDYGHATCKFPLQKIDYDENFNKEEEIYSCTLYSSDPRYVDRKVNVQINYTKKTINFDGGSTDNNVKKDIDKYKKNFDFSKKNICPTNDLKMCFLNDISWVYPKDYNTSYNCIPLDSEEKIVVGDTYCGNVVDYITNINNNKKESVIYKENYKFLRSFCNSILQEDDYDDYKYSCINLCLNLSDYLSEINLDNGECGFSDKLLIWIGNIIRWIKYLVPVLVIVFGILDFIKAMLGDKDDEMKKAQGRFVKRLIVASLIFITPFIVEFLLDVMGFDKYIEGCGIIDL